MNNLRLIFPALLGLALLLTTANASAKTSRRHYSSNGKYSFQIESGGRALTVYNHNGQSWVMGQNGHKYGIRVYNHTARRVEAVVTVDGRDVISGKRGDYRKQRGYVIEPWGSILVDGFRKNWSNVASFRFTTSSNAYATRMGDPYNLGVIGVAVFEERQQRRRPPIAYEHKASDKEMGTGYGHSRSPKKRSKSAPSSPLADVLGGYADESAPQNLGTEYGESTYSPSTTTKFVRRSKWRPNQVLTVRYDSKQGLISKGVLPPPRPIYHGPKEPNPFPNAPNGGFAPPPPPYYYE